MAEETLRIGVVGAGDNTRRLHIPNLQKLDGVEVVSVANRSRASSDRVAQQLNIPTVYDNWRALVEAPDTNAIVIGTWPYLHAAVTLAAIAAGKHVLTEARMAMSAAEAHRMLVAARAHPELTCMVVPSPFTFAIDAAIAQRVTDGYLGQLIAVDISGAAPTFADFNAPLHWRENRARSGYNIMTMGIWYEGMLRWVGEATRVMARGQVVVKQRKDPETGEPHHVTVPDHVEIIADMAFGGVAHLRLGSVLGLNRGPEIWIHGTEGTLHWAQATRTLSGGRRGDKELTPIQIPPEQQGGWRVEEEFVNAVRGREPVRRTSFEDGVRYMEFTEAVGRSLATNAAVSLPLTLGE